MREYDFKLIEKKWQEKWASISLYKTDTSSSKKKCYVLDMFPYPSGEGLHVGHPKGYIATDVYSRVKKMEGYEVLHPMGWDAFGLPAEQFAIKNKVHPSAAVTKNVSRYKEQLSLLGFNYDWSREINTTDPAFYKWTQWIFKQMYKKGLAYESNEPINWCPSCQTGLANEDLEGGLCERCGSVVEKKPLRQWVLKITEYADRMLEDLNELNWPEHIKESQRNWIGKKEGAEFDFTLVDAVIPSIKVFTTRPDTLYGVTFLAISFDVAKNWISSGWKADNAVLAKIDELEKKAKDLSIGDKDGIFTGLYAINPATQEKIQVWVANYVLSGVGTGALMGVPAHDERDFDFAKKYSLPIRAVISNSDTSLEESVMKAYSGDGVLISSADFSGVPNREAKSLIVEKFGGKIVTKYALQDWVFARQRYWGEPFPIVFNENNIPYLVADSELPVRLPDVEHYEPSSDKAFPESIQKRYF
jgi:leucyl-tRNA synthetase